MANKYLVISPNGFGNIGDDICAFSGRYMIERADPDAEVIVSQPPMKTGLVEWADFVILSGGGILYDRAPKNLENYMDYIDKAAELGKKSAVVGVGVQGIVTDEGKARYVESLSKCEFVSVRTEEDKKLLDDIGFKSAVATFDVAFSTPEMVKKINPKLGLIRQFRTQRLQKKIASSNKPKIGICLINLKMLKRDKYEGVFSEFDESMEDFIKSAKDKFDIYLIQHAKEDGKQMMEIAKRQGVTFVPYRDISDLPLIYGLYEKLDLMIGVRLHSIALGVMSGVPTIGIGSATAKQKRLADYALPTLQKQFYSFTEVDKLSSLLNKISETGKIPVSAISKMEAAKVSKLNGLNLGLIKDLR